MVMDKSECYNPDRRSAEYIEFVSNFVKYAYENASRENKSYVYCPCKKCRNTQVYEDGNDLSYDLYANGFDPTYTTWFWHGENDDDQMDSITEDKEDRLNELVDEVVKKCGGDPEKLASLHSDNKTPLYPGCSEGLTVLKATLQLMNHKACYSYSDKGFSTLLEIFKGMLPSGNKLPSKVYEAKKVLCPMGMEYEKIHACPNDCILYRKEFKDATSCPKCKTDRYVVKDVNKSKREVDGREKKKTPAKVLWYLPIIPRLERLFSNKKDAKLLTWHADRTEVDDDMIRHPVDSDQWKSIDRKFPEFASDARNLRLGLCTDGFNPFTSLNSNHSSWPVMLTIYNLPPWLCMKRKYMLLTLLISGPKQPGNDIDVYLAPLLEDLQLLWKKEGVKMYDGYRNIEFDLRAMLFCTINDFPAYGNLSGYTVKGHKACPICLENTDFCQLKHGGKTVYLGHRRWLRADDRWRRWKKAFNGKVEKRPPPEPVSGEEISNLLRTVKNDFGKGNKKSKIDGSWKKCSIFWDLPYWSSLEVRHCLDVMHIEKNICDSLVGTLLNIKGKTKDGVKARKDLVELGIRTELKPEKKGERTYLPPACYSLSKDERSCVCDCLKAVKVPIGYSSNPSKLVSNDDVRLGSMKSHDCHCFIQDLFPVAIRSVLPTNVRKCITRLCGFFKAICSKEISRSMLDKLEEEIAIVLSEMEMYFPPSFFDIMVHLTVHLVREIRLCGPVFLRWMYPFERQMKVFKGYAKNPYRPDASIVQRYVTEEAIEYCIDFLSGEKSVGLPESRHDERVDGKGLRKAKVRALSGDEMLNAHLYVLRNSDVVRPFVDQHMNFIKARNKGWDETQILNEHNRTFVTWLRETIVGEEHDETLYWLSFMPSSSVLCYSGYDIKGYTFSTKSWDGKTITQNSGVSLVSEALHVSSSKDKNPKYGDTSYYGVIDEIWELDYTSFKVPIFKCKWVDGSSVDDFGFTIVNLGTAKFGKDPYILASQAEQVFYIDDVKDKKFSIVIQGKSQFSVNCSVGDLSVQERPSGSSDETEDVEYDEKEFVEMVVRKDHNEGEWIDKTEDSLKRKRSKK